MKSLVLLLFVAYELYLCESQGISAGTVFVLKGEDVLLKVPDDDALKDFNLFSWKFNVNIVLLTVSPGNNPNIFPNYKERVEFPVNNFSVKVKNLQEADSGVYTAEVLNNLGKLTTAAEYNVKVQDRASLPLLTVVNNSVSDNSSSSCTLSVTCSTQDSHINSTFRCDNQTCSQEGGKPSEVIPDTFLQVLQSSGSIICNHSNQVSWTNSTIIIKDVCTKHIDPTSSNSVPIILGVLFLILIIIGVVLLYRWKRRQSKRESVENTVYATPEVVGTVRPQDRTDDSVPLDTTYSSVGPHTGPPANTGPPRGTGQLESVYAQINKT
ncbi:SLAM family member 9-like isoform X2 [Eleginops maclovinus]|uniref:SLAM family member 9-like isoform X2 n=1 Tax=Eleginops maclovinus TaxID=56733 RepID=UPI00308057CC